MDHTSTPSQTESEGRQDCCSSQSFQPLEVQPSCCPEGEQAAVGIADYTFFPLDSGLDDARDVEVCCGSPPGPASGSWERPGYRLQHFVTGFLATPAGEAPQAATQLSRKDRLLALLIRLGYKGRSATTLTPGLYCVGRPSEHAPVLVTANYRLSFDALRRELAGIDAWVLVIDTRGINVWCAAGKELFSSQEIVRMVRRTGLSRVVEHRELIVPQLGATGVAAQRVKKECGFSVVWGPIQARDIPRFLRNGAAADPSMRRVTFPLKERAKLIPVEFTNYAKSGIIALAVWILISGFGPEMFSLSAMGARGLLGLWILLGAALAGLVALPLLLPWLPGRAFAGKAAIAGLAAGLAVLAVQGGSMNALEGYAALILSVSVSSFLGMHFTGSTPYTSPSGVEKEMKWALPLQGAGALLACALWIGAAFV